MQTPSGEYAVSSAVARDNGPFQALGGERKRRGILGMLNLRQELRKGPEAGGWVKELGVGRVPSVRDRSPQPQRADHLMPKHSVGQQMRVARG